MTDNLFVKSPRGRRRKEQRLHVLYEPRQKEPQKGCRDNGSRVGKHVRIDRSRSKQFDLGAHAKDPTGRERFKPNQDPDK
jgi:hypothetical protein